MWLEGNVLNENAIPMVYCNQSSSASNNDRMVLDECLIFILFKFLNLNLICRINWKPSLIEWEKK